jgi:hypothetical protein
MTGSAMPAMIAGKASRSISRRVMGEDAGLCTLMRAVQRSVIEIG